MRLDEHVALITGAAAGIGRAIARRFAAEGASLVLVDVAGEKLEALSDELAAGNSRNDARVDVVIGSVADEETLREAVGRAEERFGRLDVLVSNACAAVHRPAAELSAAEWQRTLGACLTSVFYGAKHAVPLMQRHAHGSIINLTSVNSLVATPGMPAYTAAKGGVTALTRQLAVEYGPQGIRTNAIRPGFMATEATEARVLSDPEEQKAAVESCPLRRVGRPDDVADAALFLASEEATFINGHVLTVDGGASVQWAPTLVRPGLRQKAGLPRLKRET